MLFFLSVLACQPDWDAGSAEFSSMKSNSNEEQQENIEEPSSEPSEESAEEPIAEITVRPSYFIGEEIQFDASGSSDPQGYDLNYQWTCSNGLESTRSVLRFVAEEPGEISCNLDVLSESGLSAEASSKTTVLERNGDAQWTVLVYIAADNNLEAAGIEDINEMEIAGSTADVNILAQLDRSPYYTDEEGNWTGARRFYITQDNSNAIQSPVAEDLGDIDSGDYDEVVDFVRWGVSNYPADKYAVIVWNHGWSWSFTNQSALTKGIASDDSTGNYISVSNGDLKTMLEEITIITEGKLEVFGSDACIMQSWEIAHEATPYANYYVASQDYEGWDGWDYEHSMLDLIAYPTMNGAELGESIAYRFYQSGDLTQSVLDLSQMPAFEAALDSFAQTMIDEDNRQLFYQAAQNSYSYDGSQQGQDHDIGGLMTYIESRSNISPLLLQQTQDVQMALDSLILSNYVHDSVSDATGLSIYSPPQRNWGVDSSYTNSNWSNASLWDDMLLSFQ